MRHDAPASSHLGAPSTDAHAPGGECPVSTGPSSSGAVTSPSDPAQRLRVVSETGRVLEGEALWEARRELSYELRAYLAQADQAAVRLGDSVLRSVAEDARERARVHLTAARSALYALALFAGSQREGR